MSSNNRIAVPGQVNIITQFTPGTNADPVSVQMKMADGVCVVVKGGETKLERHAVAILAALSANPAVHASDQYTRDDLVDKAIDMAERLQAALQRKAEEQQAAQEAPKLDGV